MQSSPTLIFFFFFLFTYFLRLIFLLVSLVLLYHCHYVQSAIAVSVSLSVTRVVLFFLVAPSSTCTHTTRKADCNNNTQPCTAGSPCLTPLSRLSCERRTMNRIGRRASVARFHQSLCHGLSLTPERRDTSALLSLRLSSRFACRSTAAALHTEKEKPTLLVRTTTLRPF